jgi:hypothetical protein
MPKLFVDHTLARIRLTTSGMKRSSSREFQDNEIMVVERLQIKRKSQGFENGSARYNVPPRSNTQQKGRHMNVQLRIGRVR